MDRSKVAFLALCVVAAAAFPVLYSAHADEVYRIVLVQYESTQPQKKAETPDVATDQIPQYQTVVLQNEVVSTQVEKQEVTPPAVTQQNSEKERKVQKSYEAQEAKPSKPLEKIVLKSTKQTDAEKGFVQKLRLEIHKLTNAERTKAGLQSLQYDSALESIAARHSVDMQTKGYLDHVSPDGCGVTCRVKQADYRALMWGENIIWIEATTLPEAEKLATSFMKSWMDSGGHRKNILTAEYSQQGIGIAREDGVVYVTVNFAKPL